MIVKRAEQHLHNLMWIKLAQDGFHWHVFVNGDRHSSSAVVWNVCEMSKCKHSKKNPVPWVLFNVCILLYIMFDSLP